MRVLLFFLVLSGFAASAWAQQEGLLQLGDPLHRFLLRQQALGRLPDAHLAHQPLSAYEAHRHLDSLATFAGDFSRVDRTLYARFVGEVPSPGVDLFRKALPFTYRDGHHFFSARTDEYAVHIDPLLYLTYGRARQSAIDDRETSVAVWQNTRGARAAGHIGPYIFFEARLEENQRRDVRPDFQVGSTAPRLGNTKFDRDTEVYDYFVATGIVGFRSKFFEVRFGRDRNRWGTAFGSLLLSNYAPVYDQLQIRTTVWRFQYTNLFMGRSYPNSAAARERFTPRRYGALHHLSVALPARIQLELFEAVMFASSDTTGARDSGFDLGYLNPIILYRAVEADRGSPDNVLLGAGASWVAVPGLQVYTQFLIDELKVDEIGEGWWGNKWGWLAGVYAVAPHLGNASLRFEYARQRPYLYSHRTPSTAYLHYNDPLGHPAGPNTQDLAVILDAQPLPRLRGAAYVSYTRRGRNTPEANYGADPRLPYTTRVASTGVHLLDGVRQTIVTVEGHVGYEFMPRAFIELALRAESVNDEETGRDRYVAPFLMLRWGLPFQSLRY